MARIPPIAEKFNPSVTISQQSKQIAELQAEIARLRVEQSPELEEQIVNLREKLKSNSGEFEIQIERIDPNETVVLQELNIVVR
jgi:TolA-binding protein